MGLPLKRICPQCKKAYQPGSPCHPQAKASGSGRRKSSSKRKRKTTVGGGVPRAQYYGPEWRRHSKARRAEQPWCSVCFTDESLTVDHPTDAVLCRRCHGRLEHQRLADKQRQQQQQAGPLLPQNARG